MDKYFCGCCGDTLPTQTAIWCTKCEFHVLPPRRGCTPGFGLEDRTWFAQYGGPCPYQIEELG